MMLVVLMLVLVVKRPMDMTVRMVLRQVQPDARSYERGRPGQWPGQGIVKQDEGQRGAGERRSREIRAGPSRAEGAQRAHEQHEAHAVARKAQESRGGERYGTRNLRAVQQCKGRI